MVRNGGTVVEGDSAYTITRGRREVRAILDGVVASPARIADWLVASVTAVGSAQLVAMGDQSLESSMRESIVRRARFVARGWPLQYVTRTMPFHGIQLAVDGRVLIPRPETEQLVDRALDILRGKSSPLVMDVCSGSGSIALAIKAACLDAHVLGVEVSDAALAASTENAARLGLPVEWIQADVLTDLPENWLRGGRRSDELVDLIVSNPPYIADGETNEVAGDVLLFEPHLALFGGTTGLDHHTRIVDASSKLLAPEGWLLFEGHEERMLDVIGLMEAAGFVDVRVTADAAGRSRFAEGRWPSTSREDG